MEAPQPAPQPVEEYSDYSYSDYSEDEDAIRREQMIKRAAQRNANQQDNNIFSNFLVSSKKLISEISNVSFEPSETPKNQVLIEFGILYNRRPLQVM